MGYNTDILTCEVKTRGKKKTDIPDESKKEIGISAVVITQLVRTQLRNKLVNLCTN